MVGTLTAPFDGSLSEFNRAVFLKVKMRSMLEILESGEVQLEPDVIVDGVWSTVPDEYTPRRNGMLSEFIQGYQRCKGSGQPVEVWSITGEAAEARKVTCMDWLRLLGA